MEYIIAFKNTNMAIKAEQCLLEKNLRAAVMPIPSQIHAGCGICLRITPEDVRPAVRTLAEKNIDGIHLFSRTEANKKYVYEEIGDGSTLWDKE